MKHFHNCCTRPTKTDGLLLYDKFHDLLDVTVKLLANYVVNLSEPIRMDEEIFLIEYN